MEDKRVKYSDSDNLISTTTPDSHITYCNDVFCKVAGYEEEELLDKPHNVIRHEDMPKAAFGQLWQYIQSGKSWMGLVKNKCKTSGHYWVSAFVTPILDKDGSVFEYQSVRSQPSDEQIARAYSLYGRINKGKGGKRRIKWMSLSFCTTFVFLATVVAQYIELIPSEIAFWSLIALSFCQLLFLFKLKKRINSVNQLAMSDYDNPLMEEPYTGHCDDISRAELAMMMKRAELRAVTARASETSAMLINSANDEVRNCQAIDNELSDQDLATDGMAVSADEMLATIDAVSQQAKQSAEFAEDARQKAQEGSVTIGETVRTVDNLCQQLDYSKHAIEQLYRDVDGIETILEMIQSIAEQTNLLALNAAIEAARAGEHGRGFAVVSDEVRALSGKTSASVEDIRSKIEILQATVNTTGQHINDGIAASKLSVSKSEESKNVFDAILDDLTAVGEQSAGTSQAISEQVQVTQGMTMHVHRMKEAIHKTKQLSSTSVTRSHKLVDNLESLQRLVHQFSQS